MTLLIVPVPAIITIINARGVKNVAKKQTDATIAAFDRAFWTQTMGKLYGLIFDVDGVIADTEAVNARASIQVFAELFDLHDVVREDFEAGLGRGAERYVRAAAEVHGLELTAKQVEEATRLRQQYFLEILADEPLPAFPGVLELIEAAMQRKDLRLAIATSSTLEKSRAVLESANVPYRKMAYITGNDVTHKKPDPELFLLAAERIGIDPRDCVVIEDAPNGVQAAKAAGAKCIAVTNSTIAANLSGADLVCDFLEQVDLDIIRKLID